MISDDDLLLYYYRDGLAAADRARIGAALAADPGTAQRLHRLVARLDAAASQSEVPVPAATRQRWQAALEQAARSDAPAAPRAMPAGRRFNPPWMAAAAAVAVVALLVTFRGTPPPAPRTVEVATPVPGQTTGSAYERALRVHLASAGKQLGELAGASPEERARLVETIIAQNRLYALAAERAGEPHLARVLRAFTPILEDVKDPHGEPSASIAQLNFEMRVMQGRLSAAVGSPTPSTSL